MESSKTGKQPGTSSKDHYRPKPSLADVRGAFTVKPGMAAAVPRAADFANLIDLANRATQLGLGSESNAGAGLKIGMEEEDEGKVTLNLTDKRAGGLEITQNRLTVVAGPGLKLEPEVGLNLKLKDASGLRFRQGTHQIEVKLAECSGLKCEQALAVNAGAGLDFDGMGSLQVKLGSGVMVDTRSSPALKIDPESPPQLKIKYGAGLTTDENGLAITELKEGLKFDESGQLTLDLKYLMG